MLDALVSCRQILFQCLHLDFCNLFWMNYNGQVHRHISTWCFFIDKLVHELEVKAFSLKFCLYLNPPQIDITPKNIKYIENKLLNHFFKVTFKFFVLWDLNARVCSYDKVEPHGSKAVYLNLLALRTAVCPGVVGRAWSLPKTQMQRSFLYVNIFITKILFSF